MSSKLQQNLFDIFRNVYHVLSHTPLRKVPGMLSLSNVFFRMVWAEGNIIQVQGNKMYIDVHHPNSALRKTFQAYAMNLVHEETTTLIFRKLVKLGDTVLDIGANIGYFSLLAAGMVGETGKVFAFEPEPTNFSYLSKNVEINRYRNVKIFQKAVSDKNGKIPFYICPYDSGHHTINQPEGIESYRKMRGGRIKKIEIESVVLDDFLRDKTDRVDIIKMDVEGAEMLAVKGMHTLLQRHQNVKVLLEFFPLLLQKMGTSPKDLMNYLMEDHEFDVYAIGHDYSLSSALEDLVPIHSFNELMNCVREKDDHVNLLLARGPLRLA